MERKAQGLPLNTIVLAALAVLVLLILVGFTTGGLTKVFRGMTSPIKTVDLDTAKAECQQYCNELKQKASLGELTISEVENSRYALATFAIDVNKDGKLDDEERNIKCWMYPISIVCSVTLESTNTTTCSSITDQTECEQYIGCKWNQTASKCEGSKGYKMEYITCSVEDISDPNGFRCK